MTLLSRAAAHIRCAKMPDITLTLLTLSFTRPGAIFTGVTADATKQGLRSASKGYEYYSGESFYTEELLN